VIDDRVIEGTDVHRDRNADQVPDGDGIVSLDLDRFLPESNIQKSMLATHPLWGGLAANAALAVAAAGTLVMLPSLVRFWRMRRAAKRGRCPHCRYELGPSATRCPECGNTPAFAFADAVMRRRTS
jgi:hypothetical protein